MPIRFLGLALPHYIAVSETGHYPLRELERWNLGIRGHCRSSRHKLLGEGSGVLLGFFWGSFGALLGLFWGHFAYFAFSSLGEQSRFTEPCRKRLRQIDRLDEPSHSLTEHAHTRMQEVTPWVMPSSRPKNTTTRRQ